MIKESQVTDLLSKILVVKKHIEKPLDLNYSSNKLRETTVLSWSSSHRGKSVVGGSL